MAQESYRARVPGNLMLLGEHAVLHGRECLVCAVDQYMTISLSPRADERVVIDSPLGRYEGDVTSLTPDHTFRFVLSAIGRFRGELPRGFDLSIASDFSDQIGLGSSAAVTVGTLAALTSWATGALDREQLFDDSFEVIREVQGRGSCADAAASVFGGILHYRVEPRLIRKLPHICPVSAVYSGGKVPTLEVIAKVDALMRQDPDLVNRIYDDMESCVRDGAGAISAENWEDLGSAMNAGQELMVSLGVSNDLLSAIASALRADSGILGAKISGAGLGDCVLGVGEVESSSFPYDVLPLTISEKGVTVD